MSVQKMVQVWKLGLLSYDTALKIQTAIARKHLDAMTKGQGDSTDYDTLLLVEHKPIYTVGIRDGTPKDEIERLRATGAEFRKTNRGGMITFHGPGQLVAYPVLNLKHFRTSVKWYVDRLEETVINMCNALDIDAERSPYTGVWVQDNKLAAIGIHATRYVTTHGISINCNNDLAWFDNIDPCDIRDKGVTSLTQETCKDYSVSKTMPLFIDSFNTVFNCHLQELDDQIKAEILDSIDTGKSMGTVIKQ